MQLSIINSLPNEILELIFGKFCLHCRAKCQLPAPSDAYFRGTKQQSDSPSWYSLERHALFSLSLVSRRFRDIAQSVLYHEFTLGYGDSWKSTVYTWDRRLTSFMRAVARRPDLARLVKRVYVHHYLFRDIDTDDVIRAIDEAARGMGRELSHAWMLRIHRGFGENPMWLRFLASLLEKMREPSLQVGTKIREELTEKQRRWISAELVSMLIAQLPNLEHLSFRVLPWGSGDCAPPSALEVLGISNLPIKTMDISLNTSDIDMGFNLQIRALGLLYWSQQLTTLNLHKCGGTFSRVPILSLPCLTNIRMTESRIGEDSLQSLLTASPCLRWFSYEAAYSEAWENNLNGRYHFQSFHAIEALGRHRETLEFLHLDLRNWDFALSTGSSHTPSFPSLKSFTSLRRLFLRAGTIFLSYQEVSDDHQLLIDFLPQTLISLCLGGDLGETLPRLANALLGLADAVISSEHSERRQFPHLKQIQCDFAPTMDKWEIGKIFNAAGICFIYDTTTPAPKLTL